MKRNARENEARSAEDTSAVHLWLVLWKASRAVEAHAHKSIASLPICGSDFAVLEALLHKGPLLVNAIGRKVLLTSGSITAAVDRLESQGLVERRAHPTDRRARVVHLTPEGKRLIAGVFAEHERDMLVRLLKKLGLDAERALGEAAGPKESHDTRAQNATARRPRRR